MLSVSCTTWDTTNIYTAFNDLKKVYGRVDRNKLWSCLEGAGLKERMRDFLRAAYKECKCEVKVGDIVSDSLDVVKGLKQGCVLLPVLFLLCINSLVDRLRGVGVGVGLKKRMRDFLRAAYKECKCEVKVGDIVSDSLDVVKGLKQGCVLLPVLFLLCINSLVDRLRGAGVGVG